MGKPHLISFPETHYSRIPEKGEENVIEHHIAWTIKGSFTAVPYLATALEGRFEREK